MSRLLAILLLMPIFYAGILSAYNDEPGCYKDLKLTFFSPDLVKQALSMHYRTISQSDWGPIVDLLQSRSQDVPEIIKIRANRMNPNPLEYPFDGSRAAELLYQTVYEIFSDVLHGYNVGNDGQIREMFNYIKQQQSMRLQPCLG